MRRVFRTHRARSGAVRVRPHRLRHSAGKPTRRGTMGAPQRCPGAGRCAFLTWTPRQGAELTLTAHPRESYVAAPLPGDRRTRSPIWKILTTTDHKTIGLMYLITSLAFFMFGGVLALLMRAELARPGLQFFSNEQYNQLFTMHGTIMPLQIGSPDVSFPRLNALSYWLFLFGSLIATSGFLTPEGAADFGWFAYAPLNSVIHSPNVGGDLWIVGLTISGLGTILGAVNMITTILTLRAPGMTMFRMPIFTWNILVTSIMVIMVFPPLAATLLALEADRRL